MADNVNKSPLDPPYTITREESSRLDKMYSLEETLMKINKLPLLGVYYDTKELVDTIKNRIEEIRNNE